MANFSAHAHSVVPFLLLLLLLALALVHPAPLPNQRRNAQQQPAAAASSSTWAANRRLIAAAAADDSSTTGAGINNDNKEDGAGDGGCPGGKTAHTYFWTIEGPRQQQGGADGPVDSAKVDVPDVPDSNMTVVGYLFATLELSSSLVWDTAVTPEVRRALAQSDVLALGVDWSESQEVFKQCFERLAQEEGPLPEWLNLKLHQYMSQQALDHPQFDFLAQFEHRIPAEWLLPSLQNVLAIEEQQKVLELRSQNEGPRMVDRLAQEWSELQARGEHGQRQQQQKRVVYLERMRDQLKADCHFLPEADMGQIHGAIDLFLRQLSSSASNGSSVQRQLDHHRCGQAEPADILMPQELLQMAGQDQGTIDLFNGLNSLMFHDLYGSVPNAKLLNSIEKLLLDNAGKQIFFALNIGHLLDSGNNISIVQLLNQRGFRVREMPAENGTAGNGTVAPTSAAAAASIVQQIPRPQPTTAAAGVYNLTWDDVFNDNDDDDSGETSSTPVATTTVYVARTTSGILSDFVKNFDIKYALGAIVVVMFLVALLYGLIRLLCSLFCYVRTTAKSSLVGNEPVSPSAMPRGLKRDSPLSMRRITVVGLPATAAAATDNKAKKQPKKGILLNSKGGDSGGNNNSSASSTDAVQLIGSSAVYTNAGFDRRGESLQKPQPQAHEMDTFAWHTQQQPSRPAPAPAAASKLAPVPEENSGGNTSSFMCKPNSPYEPYLAEINKSMTKYAKQQQQQPPVPVEPTQHSQQSQQAPLTPATTTTIIHISPSTDLPPVALTSMDAPLASDEQMDVPPPVPAHQQQQQQQQQQPIPIVENVMEFVLVQPQQQQPANDDKSGEETEKAKKEKQQQQQQPSLVVKEVSSIGEEEEKEFAMLAPVDSAGHLGAEVNDAAIAQSPPSHEEPFEWAKQQEEEGGHHEEKANAEEPSAGNQQQKKSMSNSAWTQPLPHNNPTSALEENNDNGHGLSVNNHEKAKTESQLKTFEFDEAAEDV